jgi:hypothetical protein
LVFLLTPEQVVDADKKLSAQAKPRTAFGVFVFYYLRLPIAHSKVQGHKW